MSSSSAANASHYTMAPVSAGGSFQGSFHHNSSDRSSRSSSLSSETTHKDMYDFNAPMHPSYHQPHRTGYDDMVFPERKLY